MARCLAAVGGAEIIISWPHAAPSAMLRASLCPVVNGLAGPKTGLADGRGQIGGLVGCGVCNGSRPEIVVEQLGFLRVDID